MTGVVAQTVFHDPLVSAFAVMVVGALAIRLLLKRALWRAIARTVLLVVLTVLLLYGGIVPYQPQHPTGTPLHDAIASLLQIAWWLWAAWLLAGLLHSVVALESRPREGKLVRDLLSGVVYLAAAFAIIAYVFGLPVQGLLATSGAIAIILGLALQSTLNDVFSGVVLTFSRPYRPGDWVRLEGGTEGQVIEMNWRATHILTSHSDLAIVPNSVIAKSRIVNISSPSGVHGTTVAVRLDAAILPASGLGLLELALLNCRSILETPKPSVSVVSIDADNTGFELTFFVAQFGTAGDARNELFDLISRHVAAAGARLATTAAALAEAQGDAAPPMTKTARERALDLAAIFDTLTPGERAAIAGKLKEAVYGAGDVLMEPGIVSQSLFIVGSGVLSVARDDGVEVLRLGPGDHFGETGLLTGASSGARITALAAAVVYGAAKEDLAPILQARPQIASELSRALAQRQATGRAISIGALTNTSSTTGLGSWFADRIHSLFELGNVK